MTEDKSTPRPWSYALFRTGVVEAELRAGNDEIGILYASNGLDEPTHYDAEANAALIVQAVNSHDAMKECAAALKECLVEAIVPFDVRDRAESALSKLEKAT